MISSYYIELRDFFCALRAIWETKHACRNPTQSCTGLSSLLLQEIDTRVVTGGINSSFRMANGCSQCKRELNSFPSQRIWTLVDLHFIDLNEPNVAVIYETLKERFLLNMSLFICSERKKKEVKERSRHGFMQFKRRPSISAAIMQANPKR